MSRTTTAGTHAPAASRGMRPGVAVVLDAVCVAVFIAVGQASHAGDGAATHPLLAVAPFLAALLVAHVLVRRGRERVWPAGVLVWLVTWGGGMAVRALVNGGVAPAFLAVGLGALGVLLLGWRAVAALVRRSRAR